MNIREQKRAQGPTQSAPQRLPVAQAQAPLQKGVAAGQAEAKAAPAVTGGAAAIGGAAEMPPAPPGLEAQVEIAQARPAAPRLNPQRADQNAARRDWQAFCDEPQHWAGLPHSDLRDYTDLQPNTPADVDALMALVRFASGFRRVQSRWGDPLTRDQVSELLNSLYKAYRDHTPAVIQTGDVRRMPTTLHHLLEAGITADKLRSACFWSKTRDIGAQLTTSTLAYLAGFYTLTGTHLSMSDAGYDPATREFAAPAALIASSLLAARFLRVAEMHPGWTRAVEAGPQGNPVAAIQTDAGFWKVAAQFWPFMASLAYIDLHTQDPATAPAGSALSRELFRDRATQRMASGFVASLAVGLHRMFALTREHAWLDASTPDKARAMLGAIERLTRPRSIAAALPTYLVARPIAGLTSTFSSLDPIPQVNEMEERLSGKPSNPQGGMEWPDRPSHLPRAHQQTSQIAMRTLLLAAPLYLASVTRGLMNRECGPGGTSSYLTDVILLAAWGPAIAAIEWLTGSHPGFADENAFRAGREQVANRRQAPQAAEVVPADQQP